VRSYGRLKSQFVSFEEFLHYFEKRLLTVKFSKFCSVFIATPIDVLCSNFVKFGRREIDEIVRCLPEKKIRLALQPSLLRGSRPKSAMASPPPPAMYSECSRLHQNPSTFGRTREHRQNAP